MSKVDMNRMRRSYEENMRGGDIWNPPQGLSKLYIHPPCRDDDAHEPTKGTNYIALVVHYGLGKDNAMGVCLDPERNPVLAHPVIQSMLKKRKIKLTGKCTVCRGIDSGAMSSEEADEAKPNTRFLFGVTPVMQKMSKTAAWQKLTPKPQVALFGSTVYNGIMDVFMENNDITDMNAAIFVLIGREGAKKFDTKYTVKEDPDTVKAPKKLPDPVRKLLLKAMKPDGDCDLFRIVANMIKSPEELKTLLAGGKVATGKGRSREESEDTEESEDDGWGGDEESEESSEDTEESEDTELEDGDDDDSEGDATDEDDPELNDGDEESEESSEDDEEATEESEESSEDDEEATEESEELEESEEATEDDEEATEGDEELEESEESEEATEDDEEPSEELEELEELEDEEPAPPPKKVAKPAPKPMTKGAPAKAPPKPAPKPAAAPAKKPAPAPAKKPAKPADDDDLGLDELDAELEAISKGKAKAAPPKPAPKPGVKPGVKPGTKPVKK